jgi:serine/threonine protein kinase/Tol biopolymer transport system component
MHVPAARVLRFGDFELDVRAREMRKHGVRVRLQDQSFQILLMLLDNAGEVVLREEIQRKLWPNDTIVEFDHSINAAIKRLREALAESAEQPRYIETLPKRGYRFRGEVEIVRDPQILEQPDSGIDADDLRGQTISHFRILSRIGSGGMGVVFRAEDLTLARQVALKVLPDPINELPDSMIRHFEREAKAASTLNHPNICTIYGFEKLDGQPAIIMELLEGETLQQRLKKGALPLNQVIELAIQIAGALSAAHRKGIVHCDLKPGNIMLTKSGAKVLDFGLAKSQQLGVGTPQTNRAQGALEGTPNYMSPEQAQGEEVDARSDIFSFGLVLYEMLRGKVLFGNATSSPMILAQGLPATTPAALARVINRCLVKDREDRWQSMLDLEAELQWVGESPGLQRVESRSKPALSLTRSAWIGATVLMTLLIGLAAFLLRHNSAETPLVRFNVFPPDGALFGGAPGPAVSPDGRRFVFVTAWKDSYQLWLRPMDTPIALPLLGAAGENIEESPPFWHPNGKSVALFANGKLERIDLDPSSNARELTLCDSPQSAGGTWNSDGVILFSRGRGPLYRIPDSGGSPLAVTRVDPAKQDEAHMFPWFLPDGRHFLFSVAKPPFPSQHFTIRLGSLDSQESRPVLNADSNAIFAQGYILFVRDEKLMAQPFDSRKLLTSGDAVPVADHMAVISSWSSFAASRNGLLVYHAGAESPQFDLVWFDRGGNRLSTLGKVGGPKTPDYPLYPPQFSPDRRTLAVAALERDNYGLFLYDVARGLRSRFTFDQAQSIAPVWSPDSRTITFASRRAGHFDLYQKSADGSGTEELLYSDTDDKFPTSWCPDGRFLLYDRRSDKTQRSSIWVLPVKSGKPGQRAKPIPLDLSPTDAARGQFSPDGRWIAYESSESGRWEIYLAPF